MRPTAAELLVCALMGACSGPKSPLNTNSNSSGGTAAAMASGTSTGSTTSGSSGSGTTGTGTTGTGTAGSSSGTAGTTSGASTGGTTGPGGPCAPEGRWFGDVCAAADCAKAALGTPCALDGGFGIYGLRFGICGPTSCLASNFDYDPFNCGAYGIVCPNGYICQPVSGCVTPPPDYRAVDCQTASCPARSHCVEHTGCLADFCYFDTQAMACLQDGGPILYGTHYACCGSACAEITADPQNCGNCGLTCTQGQFCVGGACVTAATCGPSENNQICALPDGGEGKCCLDACIDPQTDFANCGSCSSSCRDGGICSHDGCGFSSADCPAGTTAVVGQRCVPTSCFADSLGTACTDDAGASLLCCDGGCIDVFRNDPQNCGGCGVTCAPGSKCVFGRCDALSDCSSTATLFPYCFLPGVDYLGVCCAGTCLSTEQDDLNCGSCGVACPLGSTCFNAGCITDGGAAASCDAGCPIGTLCAQGTCAPAQCSQASQGEVCAADAGSSPALGNCCEGSCLDVRADPNNCGGCGVRCPVGTSCANSNCQTGCSGAPCPTGMACNLRFGPPGFCQTLTCTGVPEGATCDFGMPYAGVEAVYAYGDYCCGSACTDLNQDPQNCGVCGGVCVSGICSFGYCLEPNPPGGCLQTCVPETACVRGVCVDSHCAVNSSGGSCLAEDGTIGVCCFLGGCGHLRDDPQNCGLCGIVCPAGQTCSGGTCSGSPACGPGHMGQLCDLDGGLSFFCCPGFGCTDTAFDLNNCGACGYACPVGTSCQGGVCK
jgi:hypothetical protein